MTFPHYRCTQDTNNQHINYFACCVLTAGKTSYLIGTQQVECNANTKNQRTKVDYKSIITRYIISEYAAVSNAVIRRIITAEMIYATLAGLLSKPAQSSALNPIL